MKYVVLAVNKETSDAEPIGIMTSREDAKSLLWVSVKNEQGISDRHRDTVKEQEYADTTKYRYQIIDFQ